MLLLAAAIPTTAATRMFSVLIQLNNAAFWGNRIAFFTL
jgi:hypothetical protein